MDIGIIGLGTMAENLILNLNEKGKTFAIHNRTIEKAESFVAKNPTNKMAKSINELVCLLEMPRVIILFIPAGQVIDEMLLKLDPLLDTDDVVIDLGNSCYLDTTRRVNEHNFLFVGCGISGGEMGARYGASLMPGGNSQAWHKIEPIFNLVAAKHNNSLCCKWLGSGGSGHLVKTIHNGIEYAIMAVISEIASLLQREEASELFKEWNLTDESFLLEIAGTVLKNPKIDDIEDIAHNKGTGVWSSIASLKHQTCLSVITEAVYARIISKEKMKRIEMSKYGDKIYCEVQRIDLRSGFELATLISYIQGLMLIQKVSDSYEWNLNLFDILEIWKNGSIIKSKQLDFLQRIIPSFEVHENFVSLLNENLKGFRRLVSSATLAGIPIPTLTSALNYIHSLCDNNGNGRTIQAMRDFFGAHQVRFKDSDKDVHVFWNE